jgi:hypothetical protein
MELMGFSGSPEVAAAAVPAMNFVANTDALILTCGAMAAAPRHLTSGRTFSAAEEFTYDLKHLKRATTVGETTGGGAHPGASAGSPVTSASGCRRAARSIRSPGRTGKAWHRARHHDGRVRRAASRADVPRPSSAHDMLARRGSRPAAGIAGQGGAVHRRFREHDAAGRGPRDESHPYTTTPGRVCPGVAVRTGWYFSLVPDPRTSSVPPPRSTGFRRWYPTG